MGKNKPVQDDAKAVFLLKGMVSWSLSGRWTLWYPWLVISFQMFIIIFLLFKLDPNKITCQQRVLSQHNSHGSLRFDPRVSTELDSTVYYTADRVFYNRVPKCGSSALKEVIIELAHIHNFTFARSPVYMTHYMDPEFQENLVKRFMDTPAPLLYERHLHFMQFVKYGGQQPLYFNLVRDPLERLVSWYYFRRFQEGHIRDMPNNKRVRSYDACVLGNFSECVEPMGNEPEEGYFKLIPFFCGQDDFCRQPGEKSLIQAIQNVKKYYAVVGVTEEYPQFIEALEYVIPSFFRGASLVYKRLENELTTKYKTTYKLPVSQEVRNIMYPKLAEEYQFYSFIRNRFNKLSKNIKTAKEKLQGRP